MDPNYLVLLGIVIVIIGLAIPYHSEQVDPGIALIVDDRPVEGGDVIETFTIYRGEGMSYLEEIV